MKLQVDIFDCLGRPIGRADEVNDHLPAILKDVQDGILTSGKVLIHCPDPKPGGEYVNVVLTVKEN